MLFTKEMSERNKSNSFYIIIVSADGLITLIQLSKLNLIIIILKTCV